MKKRSPKPKAKRSYPWKEWWKIEGPFRIVQGVHFEKPLKLMAAQVRNRAWHDRLSVSVAVEESSKSLIVEVKGGN